MTSTMTGTLMRNTEPHQKCSSSHPPTSGPSAAPPVAPADQIAIARVRWRASRNMPRMSDRVEGMRVAPATPSRARAAISTSGEGEKAAIAEATPKPREPVRSSRLRPIRSATLPIVTSSPASAKE